MSNRRRARKPKPQLDEDLILLWADKHYARFGVWPKLNFGPVYDQPGETWKAVNQALRVGRRGLLPDSTLALLLQERRGVVRHKELPSLTEAHLLRWADRYHEKYGRYPHCNDGPIEWAVTETWAGVDKALDTGFRGLPGGSSLAKLLEKYRNKRNLSTLPHLSLEQILEWMDEHHDRTGEWPTVESGEVRTCPSEQWSAINSALGNGMRGLPGRSSLVHVAIQYRGRKDLQDFAPLTKNQIADWIEKHAARHGHYPTSNMGAVDDVPGERWSAINNSLRLGQRTLTGGQSLDKLKQELIAEGKLSPLRRRSRAEIARLQIDQIAAWIQEYTASHGEYPHKRSGAIENTLGETWEKIDSCLISGNRGLPGRSSLAQLRQELIKEGSLPDLTSENPTPQGPHLTKEQITEWMLIHASHHGKYPTKYTGQIQNAPGEKWSGVDRALIDGARGLSGGQSLESLRDELIVEGRFSPPAPIVRPEIPNLSREQIITWMADYFARHGKYPSSNAGAIDESETWAKINDALIDGRRGLPGGQSLPQLRQQLLDEGTLLPVPTKAPKAQGEPTKRRRSDRPSLTVNLILSWADEHFALHGKWPQTKNNTAVTGHPGESWHALDMALRTGGRDLEAGTSLANLLQNHRGVLNTKNQPTLTIENILLWSDRHFELHGRYPEMRDEKIDMVPNETWSAVNRALRDGTRGLPGGSTLAQLLKVERNLRNGARLNNLRIETILEWADEHHARTGKWPAANSGVVQVSPGEHWYALNSALISGGRGLSPGTSLARVLQQYRGKAHPHDVPDHTIETITAWMRSHAERHGKYPSCISGPVEDAPGETWGAIQISLLMGSRGLPGGSSVAKLRNSLIQEGLLPDLRRRRV